MTDLNKFVKKHKLILVEDTCESLGSFWTDDQGKQRMLGTLGDFGCYSFYFSHHITTGEGGAVVCHTEEDWDTLKCMRAHGWSREMSNKVQLEHAYPDIDPRFLFIHAGFN